MKRFLLCATAIVAIALRANAGPGDTTWVQAQNDVQLDYYNNFDTPAAMPDGATSYRKIYMIFTLGKYVCPGSPQYCSDWDYTVQNFLMTPGGDTLELARLITPYASSTYSSTPANWTHRYVYDVTDYYPLLQNNNTIRVLYSGYSGGFTANIKFAFIEGQRERDVLGIHQMYNGSFAYGNTGDQIENHLTPDTIAIPAGTVYAALRMNITGHGSDNTGCSEFCSKYYKVVQNGVMTEQQQIWRDDCGRNEVYPQSGTWIYDRGNWCPGALVRSNWHELPGVAGNTSHIVDVDMQPYTGSGSASYTIEGTVFYYSGWNKTADASLDDVLAPTDHEAHYREGNSCAQPVVSVKNTGAAPITTLNFSYGLQGGTMDSYSWTGAINSGQSADISLPATASIISATGTNTFSAQITSVNGTPDADATNDVITSTYTAPASWMPSIIVWLKTNAAVNGFGISETSWKILDANNSIVAQRSNAGATTLYKDSVTLQPNSCYRLEVTDAGCDGLSFWANPDPGNGYLKVYKGTGIGTYSMQRYRNADFGCGFTQFFKTDGPATAIEGVASVVPSLTAWPNPASSVLQVQLDGVDNTTGILRLTDATGRVVVTQSVATAATAVSVAQLSPGYYVLSFQDEKGAAPRVVTRVLIMR